MDSGLLGNLKLQHKLDSPERKKNIKRKGKTINITLHKQGQTVHKTALEDGDRQTNRRRDETSKEKKLQFVQTNAKKYAKFQTKCF